METNSKLKTVQEEAILKAVMFWSDIIQKPANKDNGDKSDAGGMTMMLAMLVGVNHLPTKEQINEFEAKLEIALKAMLANERPYHWHLDCDYNPCQVLADCANRSGINTSVFPWKTYMRITENFEVFASVGYGAESKQI